MKKNINSLKEDIEKLKKENLYRERIVLGVDKKIKILCSNDYLNLSENPFVKLGAIEATLRFGAGSTGSQLVSGYLEIHREIEEILRFLKKTEKCITVGSGYLANIGLIPALADKPEDLIISDQLNHASIIDGVRLSKAKKVIYPHKDTAFIKKFLEKERNKYRRCLIITDGVFSMDGDIAPLHKLIQLAEKYECFLIVDDAHATGTIGYSTLDFYNIQTIPEYVIQMGTFSKAIGSYGAYICASETIIEYLVNKARSIIFSTSLPPSVLGAVKNALMLIKEKKLTKQLMKLSQEIKTIFKKKNIPIGESGKYPTPIVPIMVFDEEKALELKNILWKEGFFIQAIRYPTVPRGKARLRLTISLKYEKSVYEELIEILEKTIW
jgi:8-amino-7-oxononanoate synthase